MTERVVRAVPEAVEAIVLEAVEAIVLRAGQVWRPKKARPMPRQVTFANEQRVWFFARFSAHRSEPIADFLAWIRRHAAVCAE